MKAATMRSDEIFRELIRRVLAGTIVLSENRELREGQIQDAMKLIVRERLQETESGASP
jgi:hypothetical protein